MSAKGTVVLGTEPIFSIHIDFPDGSNPVEYHNLNLKQTTVVLAEWSENWILTPDKDCKLNDTVWNWHANARGLSLADIKIIFGEDEEESDEDSDSEPILEDELNKED